MILVTGGAGFIGANFVLEWLRASSEAVLNVDKLTYAGNPLTLSPLQRNRNHVFVRVDICDRVAIDALLARHQPRAILHFAAESHVDRSINEPAEFVQTNVTGTFTLLDAALSYWRSLPDPGQAAFRFLHVSTDEVFGSLAPSGAPFSETARYAPNSPYSATKAASDHLVRSYHRTYGLPTVTTHCSNNYGPYQFPEKLIPLMIMNAIAGESLPVYGDGMNIRDWLHVSDHCAAIREVLARGRIGDTYNVGGWNEKTNLGVVHAVCDWLDRLKPKAAGSYRDQIAFVNDRPGHDRRYAIDSRKLERELGWKPAETFETGIEKTVRWYLGNQAWVGDVVSGAYRTASIDTARIGDGA